MTKYDCDDTLLRYDAAHLAKCLSYVSIVMLAIPMLVWACSVAPHNDLFGFVL
jgi:hypothetical protein